jgi:hypothetical protein
MGLLKHILFLALILLSFSSSAETIRITAWNLDDRSTSIEQAAATLSQLNPDVILLQPVRDWQSASALAQALKPADYNVLVCSAFPTRPGDPRTSAQTAILAKRQAYFTWSTPWKAQSESSAPGGFVFAAIQAGKRRIGFFSAELDYTLMRSPTRGAAVSSILLAAIKQQWSDEVTQFRNWTANRLDRVVVAGFPAPAASPSASTAANADTSRAVATLLAGPLDQPGIAPVVNGKAEPQSVLSLATPVAPEDSLSGVVLTRCPLTVDLELNPVAAPAITQADQGKDFSTATAPDGWRSFTTGIGLIIWVAPTAGLIALLIAAIWVYRRRSGRIPQSEPVLITSNAGAEGELAGSYTLVLNSPQSENPPVEASNPNSPPATENAGSSNLLLESWQRRALSAEQRAAQAQAALRAGALGHLREWIRHHLFRGLMSERTRLLETQQAATLKAMAVDARLEKIETQLQQQNRAYLERIEKLTGELIAATEENRELILAQISQVKAEMESARVRLLSQARTEN